MARYLQAAFDQVCKDAKPADGWYVSLMEQTCEYGGPEEGGWWRHNLYIVAYQYFSTEEAATAAKEAVIKLAEELQVQSRREHGDRCLREMEWCDARGLDADYLPEPDGPSEYSVWMTEGLPEEYRAPTHYE